MPLMLWQQHVVDVAYELDEDGGFVYEEVDLTVPRQSGKTTLVVAKTSHRLVKMPRTHGRQRSVYTAQTRAKARDKFERDFAEVLRAASPTFREITGTRARPRRPVEWKISLNNGSENIHFGRGNYWLLDAPTDTAGHGDTIDDYTIDEAFALETDDVEGGMAPATATRRDAQGWVLSTAGTEKSYYLWRKILAGRSAFDSGNHGRIAYFEWSAPEDADPADPRVWRACSPALGITIDERFLEAQWAKAQRKGQEGIDTFRRSYLNQWPHPPNLDDETQWVIPERSWKDCASLRSGIGGKPVFALAVSQDREWSCFAVAGRSTTDPDITQAEVFEYDRGTAWTIRRAEQLVADHPGAQVAIVEGSPAASLLDKLHARRVPTAEISAKQYVRACGQIFDAVVEGRFRHRNQQALNIAVKGAQKRDSGDAFAWSQRRSTVDIAPLEAVTAAVSVHGIAEPNERGPMLWTDEDED